MTHYASCIGCIAQAGCHHRDMVRLQLRGLGVTSIKWKCKERIERFRRGAPVWVVTIADRNNPTFDEDSIGRGAGPERNTFPGFMVRQKGAKALVYIAEGAQSQCEETIFVGGPFCMIPLSRISARDGDPEQMCQHCDRPSSAPHAVGYRCNPGSDGWVYGWPHDKDLPLSKITYEPADVEEFPF